VSWRIGSPVARRMKPGIVFLGEAVQHEPDVEAQPLACLGAVDAHLEWFEMRECTGLPANNQSRMIRRGHFEVGPGVTAAYSASVKNPKIRGLSQSFHPRPILISLPRRY